MRNLLRPRTFVVAAVAMLLSGGAYAFTASNSVPATTAGNGSGAISGYTVGSVTYTLSQSDTGATDASPVIASVSFAICASGSTSCTSNEASVAGGYTAPTLVDAVFTAGTTGGGSTMDYNSCSVPASTTTWTCVQSGTPTSYESVADAGNLSVTATANSSSAL